MSVDMADGGRFLTRDYSIRAVPPFLRSDFCAIAAIVESVTAASPDESTEGSAEPGSYKNRDEMLKSLATAS